MFSKKLFICATFVAFYISKLTAFQVDFSTVTYNGRVPDGWMLQGSTAAYVSLTQSQPQTPSGSSEAGLNVNFYSATKQNLLYCTSKIDDPLICDTVVVKLRYYAQPEAELVDAFQVVVSTNASFSSYVAVGDPFEIEELGRTNAEWVTRSRIVSLNGLSMRQPDLYVGILLIPAGRSHAYGQINSLDLSIAASATPTDVCLKCDGVPVGRLLPCDNVYVSTFVTPDPNDGRLELEGVYGVVDRKGIVSTNRLVRIAETDEYVGPAISPAMDAGEKLIVTAFTKYKSDLATAGTVNGDDGYAYQVIDSGVSYVVGKAGSVWINEFGFDRAELCGTTNRVMFSGWMLELSKTVESTNVVEIGNETGTSVCETNVTYETVTYHALLEGVFDFTKNMINGVVGLETRNLTWKDAGDVSVSTIPDGEYVLQLRNARGIVEHEEIVELPLTRNIGMSGFAQWPDEGFEYDWAGTATSDIFSWGPLAEPSIGSVNAGQGFNAPASIDLTIFTKVGNDEVAPPISQATVSLTVANFANAVTQGTIVTFDEVSKNGLVAFEKNGWSPNTNDIHATISGSAFGWLSEEKGLVLTNGLPQTNSLAFSPSVAYDDFSKFAGCWTNLDSKLKWEVASVSADGESKSVLRLNTYSVTTGKGVLKCENYLSANGNKICSVGFDYRNTVDTYPTYDEFCVIVGTNSDFSVGTFVSTPPLSNKRTQYGNGEWYHYLSAFELPMGFSDASEIWVQLLCNSKYRTHTYTYVDNLRIAFQDVAMPTNLMRSVAAPVNGESTAFTLDVVPQTSDEVQEVSADLHLVLNGVTNIVPFAFADGTLTNAISLVDGEAQAVQMGITAAALEEALGGPFMTGDEVTYFAAVRYNSANGALDPAEVYETRYFPDNATTSNEYWIVEGTYGLGDLSANTFTVTGDVLSCIGTPDVTTEGVKFTLHGYDANGISALTVNVNGTDYHPFEGLDTNAQVRVTGEFVLPTGLAANTDYTVTITAKDANGADIAPASFTFTTLPVATSAAVEPVSQTETRLTVSGSAAGYVVPAGWTQTSLNTWTRNDGTPNSLVSAAGIYGTNKLGQASATIDATPAYTLAAVATKAPVVVKGETTVTVSAGGDYALADDGNPEGTEYAVRVTTSNADDAFVSTNDVPVWKTLNEWKSDEPLVVSSPTIDLAATNYFSFVTRNADEVVTGNPDPATTNCWFEMTAGFVGAPAQKTASSRADSNFGKVGYSLAFADPAQSADARAEVEYRIDRGEWTALCDFPVSFAELTSGTNLEWDAWSAVNGIDGEYVYNLRARVYSESSGRTSEWDVFDEGALDFAPPSNLAITGSPANGAITSSTGYDFAFSASDSHDVAFDWALTGGTRGTGGTAAGGNLSDGSYTITVTATDAMGNVCDAVSRNWTVDTTSPTGLAFVVAPAEGTVTNLAFFSITASANDATVLTYRWTLNGEDVAGTAATYVGDAAEGTNTVSVYAEDTAGNSCAAVTRTWVVDTVAPTAPVISGKPAALTNTPAFTMSAASDDATALTYHWTFNGVGTVGASLADNAREGANSVSVYATDEAGNVSATTSYSWTLDTTAPSGLAMGGTPAQGATTANSAVSLTASATDAHAITYRWTFNGVASEGAALNATAKEGLNTASVVAVDAAGNACAVVTRTWTLDTTKPANLAVEGTPTDSSLVNVSAFSFTASATDATSLSYHWTLNGVVANTTSDAFAGTAAEGENTVSVYAEDAAGNKSDEATVSWTLDTTAPTGLAIGGTPAQGATTANSAVSLTASATDVHAITYRWTFNGVASEGAALNATAKEGLNTASVVAVDAAGNASAAVTRTWTLDTTAPSNLAVEGTPATGSIVNVSAFDFTASASDATTITYHWTFGEETAAVTNFTGTAGDDGEYTVSVYAEDAAGNKSEPVAVSWTLDTVAPADLAIAGTPAQDAVTANDAVSLTASATDVHAITYRWTFNGVASEGTTLNATAKEGLNTASVVAVDAAGNACAAVTRTWTLDTIKPTTPVISGTPSNGMVVNSSAIDLVAASEDATTVTYHWTFGEEMAVVTNFTGTASEDGAYTISVYAEDAAGNKSDAASIAWTLDSTAPTEPEISGKPATITNVKDFTMSASSTDATALVYTWTFNGAESTGPSLAGTAIEGENSVSVYATDAGGNVSPTTSYAWTLDTVAPTGLSIGGAPAQGAVTANAAVTLTASATDNLTAAENIVYRWTLNGVASEGAALNATAKEGLNTASVVAVDAAGNVSEAVSRTWTLDTTKPTAPVVTGTPEAGAIVNVAAFSLTAASTDANAITYHWTFNGAASTGESLSGEAIEGENTASVYAEDTAGNKSDVVEVVWTFDATAPVGLAIEGTPSQGIVTANGSVALFASATDNLTAAEDIVYRWTFNGVASEGAALNATAKEGENTASVVAVDAAGNACAAVTRTWTLDTTAPANLSVAGTPADGSIVNASAFDFTASASDATTITYHWTFGEETAAVTNFTGTAGNDGEYTVSVYAEDAAGNKSETVAVSWTLDTVAPADLAIDGTPAQGAVTANDAVSLTASATDDNAITYRWTFNGVASEGAALNATAKEGENTASVVAVDAAGNACAAVTRTWTLDTTAPTNLAIAGAPVEGAATNDTAFNFTAFAEDDSKPLAYHWKLSWTSVPGVTGEKDIDGTSSNCVDVAVENATNVVSVHAVDAAGNPCDPVTRTWVVDTVAPSMPEFDEKPDSFTNGSGYRFVVSSTDALSGVSEYFWSFDGGVFEPGSATLEGVVAESREYELLVYAVDAAGNSSATNSYTWTIDATKPTVTLESNTPDPFNANDTFTVTVTFSEKVTGFAADKVTVDNGSVRALTESQDEENTNKVFVVTIVPDNDDVTSISVQVEADKVQDLAGNWNEASEPLSSSCVLKRPTVTLSTQTASYFHKGENFAVAVEFSGVVTDFSASSLTVENGSATVEGSGALYTVTITPINDGAISVQIGDNMVHDTAGNGNVASSILVRTYDTTAPTGIVLAGTPANGSTTNSKDFEITVESVVEANAAAGLIYRWSIDDGQYKIGPVTYTGSVEPGEHYVRVKIRDTAQNWSEVSSAWTWTYEKPVTSGIEFDGGVTLPVDPDTGATNSVEFVTIDFKPGDACSFSLKGFEATGTNISNLQMWFVVGETLGGPRAHVKVSTNATYNETDKELIVTLPATATQGKSSFFIFGIDNKGE